MDEFFSSNVANFIWGCAAFVIFVLIVYLKGAKQILAMVDAREQKIAREIKEAEDAYQRAKKVQADVDAKFAAAESKIADLMAEARRDAEKHKADLVEKGRSEIEATRQRSLRDIDAARHAALITLRQEIANVSVQVAEKIVREKLDAAKHEQLVAQTLEAYEAGKK